MDFVILSNDQAIFDAAFPPAIVVPVPGTITGSGPDRSGGRMACVLGDEATVRVPGVPYSSGAFTGGVGILTILALGPDQQAVNATAGGLPLILRGSQFRARFQVVLPATNATGADAVPVYFGTGSFLTSNSVWRAD